MAQGPIKQPINVIDNLTSTSATSALSANQGKVLNDKATIASGSNYVKFSDGTLICFLYVSKQFAVNTAWGNLYESGQISLGNWPQSFISTPIVSIINTAGAGMIEMFASTSKTAIGNVVMVRPTATASNSYTFHVIGIGRWK